MLEKIHSLCLQELLEYLENEEGIIITSYEKIEIAMRDFKKSLGSIVKLDNEELP